MYLLFEVGGTKTRIGYSQDGKGITSSQIMPTPQNPEELINILSRQKVKAACGGLAGVLDPDQNMLVSAPHLLEYVGVAFRKSLSEILQAPVFLENDAALAGLGEVTLGNGKGYKIVAYIAIGTGIGGARFVDGKIDRKVYGFEPGHQIINLDGMDFEQYISGTALALEFGHPSEQIHDPKVWEMAAERLAIGLNNVVLLWSPEVLILGGGLMQRIPLEKVKFYLKEVLKLFPQTPLILPSKLGELSGINGALQLMRQNHVKLPKIE